MKIELKTTVVAFVCALVMSAGVHAQESDAFKKYGQEFKGKIAKSYAESKEWWPTLPKPPAGTPNVIIFLLDDVGFAQENNEWIKYIFDLSQYVGKECLVRFKFKSC